MSKIPDCPRCGSKLVRVKHEPGAYTCSDSKCTFRVLLAPPTRTGGSYTFRKIL